MMSAGVGSTKVGKRGNSDSKMRKGGERSIHATYRVVKALFIQKRGEQHGDKFQKREGEGEGEVIISRGKRKGLRYFALSRKTIERRGGGSVVVITKGRKGAGKRKYVHLERRGGFANQPP